MASSFPSSLDAFTNPSSADALDSVSVPHASQHSDLNDAVEALEAKVGADGSAVVSSHDYKIAQLEDQGTWVDYSGSQTFTGLSIGNGTVASYYAQIGDVVFMRGEVALGSTSTLTGPVDMSIPVTANSANVSVHWGESCMFRGSGNWLGNMLCISTTTYRFINLYVSGSDVLARDIGTNTPFTWTTTNRITWSYSYRAA